MPGPVDCPICNAELGTPQALHGHLRFAHDIREDELEQVYAQALEDQNRKRGEDGDQADLPLGAGASDNAPSEVSAETSSTDGTPKTTLSRIEGLRGDLNSLDGFQASTALQALDQIEMVVRERVGTGKADEALMRKVVDSLEWIANLVECRRQRTVIEQKFDGEKAKSRVERLEIREAEIRSHLRKAWDLELPAKDFWRDP